VAEQPVRRQALFLRPGPRAQNFQLGIDLHGVGIDDDPAETPGKLERGGRLAARRRPCDKDRPFAALSHQAT
jgi:hypothetical protein